MAALSRCGNSQPTANTRERRCASKEPRGTKDTGVMKNTPCTDNLSCVKRVCREPHMCHLRTLMRVVHGSVTPLHRITGSLSINGPWNVDVTAVVLAKFGKCTRCNKFRVAYTMNATFGNVSTKEPWNYSARWDTAKV